MNYLSEYRIVIGASGALLILIAFFMNQTGRWKNDYLIYDFINLVGSGLLMAYAILLVSYPFMVLNLIWMIVSLRDVVLDIAKGKKRKKSKKSGKGKKTKQKRTKLMHKVSNGLK